MNLQHAYDQTAASSNPGHPCAGAAVLPAGSCGRPFPSVRRVSAARAHRGSGRPALIAISQRDDTVVVAASEARRLARALIRAAGRR